MSGGLSVRRYAAREVDAFLSEIAAELGSRFMTR